MTSSSSDSDFHVTFSLPSSAAALLKELADGGNQGLRDLGVVSVHINSPGFHEGCTVSPRKSARESEVPLSTKTSHLDRLSLSCHSFPSQDDLENTRQNIRHYLSMQMADTGNVDHAVPNRNASAPTQQPLEMPRHIPEMSPMNTHGHSLSFAEASQLPVRHRLDPAKSLVSEMDHGHQKLHNADAESWKPACSSYWNWQQNHYRLAYADVAVDGYGPHSGLARPVSPMYARSPPYAFNPCSPRLRTGYQMLPPSHFQEPFAHLENERAWQHTSHTTSPYLMNLLHSNSSHAARNQRLAGPFETVLALPSGQTKKKFHRSRKDVALTRPGSHATDPLGTLGSVSTYDEPAGTLGFGPGQSSFAFPMAHNVCHPDIVEQNQQIYAAAQSAHVNKSQANAVSAPSRVSTSCLVTSPPAFAMPTSAHVATASTYVTSPSESVMFTPAHAMLTTECAVSMSHVVASSCSESPRATDISSAMGQLASTKLMSSAAHPVSAPHVFLTSAHVMTTPQHVLCSSAHATSLPKDGFSVPLCHVMPVSSLIFSDASANAITRPVKVESTPSLSSTSPALTTSTVRHIVAPASPVTMTRATVDSPLTCVDSAHISPEFSDRQLFRSGSSGAGVVAAGECRPDWSSKSKIQDDCSIQCSLKENSANLNTRSHDEQVCNGELERFPDLTQQMNRTTCSVEKTLPLTILPAVGSMGSVLKDQGLISCSSEFMSVRKMFSSGRVTKSPVQSSSNEIIAKAIISRKPEDAESQLDAPSLCYPSSTVDKQLQDTSSSVSSSHTIEMTSIDLKVSISANSVSESPMSVADLQKAKKMSSRGQEPSNTDLESENGQKMQNKSEDISNMSVLLPPVISNTWISKKATEEMMVSMHVVADSIPPTVDNGHARFQGVDVVVQENVNTATLAPDDSQASATSEKQHVWNVTGTMGSLKPAVDTFIATDDSAEGNNGKAHEKGSNLECAVSVEQTITDGLCKDDYSLQTAVKSSFQTKYDADFSNDMQETVDGTGETSSSMKIGTDNILVTDNRMQTGIQNVCANVFTSSNSEQMKCNNGKESRSNIAVSSNGVESCDATEMLHGNERVCNLTATDAVQFPISIVKTAIDDPSSTRENFSCVLLRSVNDEKLAGNVESAIQNRPLLDLNAKLVGQTTNCSDDNDSKVMELVGSEQGTAECVQPAQVNLRLKLHKEEVVQNVSDSFEEISPKKRIDVTISGAFHSSTVLDPCQEVSQKTTFLEDGQRSYSPQATASNEVTGLVKPCGVDGRSLQFGITSASEGGQKKSVVDDVSFPGHERNFVDTSVFQHAKSLMSEPQMPDFRATLQSKHFLANCNASLLAASTSQMSADKYQVALDGTVSERVDCSDQIQQCHERSKSADCDITGVRCDATAGTSCQGVGIQPNGLVPEMIASPEVPNFSDSHPTEQLRMVVSSETVTGFSRQCVADVGSVNCCSAETVSTLALNSPSHKEVSLSSEALPCLTVKREDELSDREPSSSQISSSSGFDEAISAMHSEILHSDSKTVSLSVAPVSESLASTSLELVPSAPKSSVSHSCVRQTPVSCAPVSAGDHVFFGKDARSSVFDEDVLSGPLPAKRLRTSETN